MPFRLHNAEPLADGCRRIVMEQIERALQFLQREGVERDEAIHEVRRRGKRIRAALRLFRPALGNKTYTAENRRYRDLAARISPARDATALIECSESLIERFRDELDLRSLQGIKRRLHQNREHLKHESKTLADELRRVEVELREGARSVAEWPFQDETFAAIEDGLRRTYRRAQRAMRRSQSEATDENLHEWRKRVKYHGFHLRLLQDLWPPVFRPLREEAAALARDLGDDHDLGLLGSTIRRWQREKPWPSPKAVNHYLQLVRRRRAELQISADRRGRCLLADKPAALLRRCSACWRVAREST